MEYREEIKNYVPYNEQEEVEKEEILQYCQLFPNILTRECKIAHFCASRLCCKSQEKQSTNGIS